MRGQGRGKQGQACREAGSKNDRCYGLIPLHMLGGVLLPFTDEATEAQRGLVTHSRSHSKTRALKSKDQGIRLSGD